MSLAFQIALFAILGGYFPWNLGLAWLDPLLLMLLAASAALLSLPREDRNEEISGQRGFARALMLLFAGLITLNVRVDAGTLVRPAFSTFVIYIATAAAASLAAMQLSERKGVRFTRTAFMMGAALLVLVTVFPNPVKLFLTGHATSNMLLFLSLLLLVLVALPLREKIKAA
jgi:hypothetical protein